MSSTTNRCYSPGEVAACVVAKLALRGYWPEGRWPERARHYVNWLWNIHADRLRETDPRDPIDQLREILGAVPDPPKLELIR